MRPPPKHIGRFQPSTRCGGPPPAGLRVGIAQFNEGAYFECHETLEDIWKVEPDPVRFLYQGILKIAAGLHKLGLGNQRGCLHLLDGGMELLQPFRPTCMGVNVDLLLARTARCRERIASLSADDLASFDRAALPGIEVAG